MTNYYLGIDGGGSKTHFVVIDNNSKVVFEKTEGPSAIDTVGIEGCLSTISGLLKAMPNGIQISSVFAGIGGVSGVVHEEELQTRIKMLDRINKDAFVKVKNDVSVALLSKDGTFEGMTLILGTGSVCYGVHHGKEYRVGGYHFQEGDLGSAYDLGTQAMRHLAKVLDKRNKSSDFANQLMKETNVYDFVSMAAYFDTWNRSEVAKLAKIVTKFASVDEDAMAILENASNEVFHLVRTLYHELAFDETKLVLVGGLANADTLYKTMFLNKIHSISKKIEIISPKYTPAEAAAVYAKNVAN
ncbi:MAG: BadF/BadG/BcrA/BcrD ATPase family protein [Candidatus Izemoplasmatales bacterium]|nr:BadF/BadG/BcrA/BcrD ATPase family protein [Candidatus Izemoplasmatales bacterium]